MFSPYLEHVSGSLVFPSSAFLILSLVRYLCAVSYTHLDVYKRQVPEYLRVSNNVFLILLLKLIVIIVTFIIDYHNITVLSVNSRTLCC